MAMSKPGTQDAGQIYLVCNTEGCEKNCQFTVMLVIKECVKSVGMNI